jgi:hypothetical protein
MILLKLRRSIEFSASDWQRFVSGKLVDTCNKDCLFTAEYHSGQLALRDRSGAYLSPIGSKAVLKTRSNTVTKDELFSLEDSLPQASFVAALNSKFVSVKQGKEECESFLRRNSLLKGERSSMIRMASVRVMIAERRTTRFADVEARSDFRYYIVHLDLQRECKNRCNSVG